VPSSSVLPSLDQQIRFFSLVFLNLPAYPPTAIKTIRPTPKLEDPIAESVRLSFYPEASGDIKVLLKPYHLFTVDFKKSTAFATTHGSPHPYDTHVPLFAYGPGIRPGTHAERITPQALTGSWPAPQLAAARRRRGAPAQRDVRERLGHSFWFHIQQLLPVVELFRGQLPFCFRARSGHGRIAQDHVGDSFPFCSARRVTSPCQRAAQRIIWIDLDFFRVDPFFPLLLEFL